MSSHTGTNVSNVPNAGDDDVCKHLAAFKHVHQASAAAGLPLALHLEAERQIRARAEEAQIPLTPALLQLGEFPSGCHIVPNPYNGIPGFSLDQHFFLPGFPQMAWPMVEWVLDTNYAAYTRSRPKTAASVIVWDNNESMLLPLMQKIEQEHPGVKIFSLPSLGSGEVRGHLELGVRGEPEQVAAAMNTIQDELRRLGVDTDVLRSP